MTFLDGFSQITGTDDFVNSGVGLARELDPSKIDFDTMGVFDHVGGQVEGVEHPQPQQIERDDSHCSRVILVPLDNRSSFHPPPFQRHHLP